MCAASTWQVIGTFALPQLCDSADANEANNDSNCISETGAARLGD